MSSQLTCVFVDHGLMRLNEGDEVEAAFRRAARDRSALPELAELLRKHKMFDEYEDRFFRLARNS